MSMSSSIGDGAQTFSFQRRSIELNRELDRLTAELGSGQAANTRDAVRADFAKLTAVERGLRETESYRSAASDAALIASSQQNALELIASESEALSTTLLINSTDNANQMLSVDVGQSTDTLNLMLNALNTGVAGQHIFAGTATDQAPMVTAEAMLAELRPIINPAMTADEMITAIDSWFNDSGGGFETVAYKGNAATITAHIGDGEAVDIGTTALSPGIRGALMGVAMTALIAEGSGPMDISVQQDVLRSAAETLRSGDAAITQQRAKIGSVEGQIEATTTRHDTAINSLKRERTNILGIDAYETSTQLDIVEAQLETLYILTNRLAKLTLTEFLR
jgi:flagellar hook-associated protein 3 FlgL